MGVSTRGNDGGDQCEHGVQEGSCGERRAEALRNFGKEQSQPSLIRKGVVEVA